MSLSATPDSLTESSGLLGRPRGDLRLKISRGESGTEIKVLEHAKSLIGSHQRCHLRLQEPGVSPVECLLLHGEAQCVVRWFCEDLDGTAFEDEVVRAGDSLQIGPFEIELLASDAAHDHEPETLPQIGPSELPALPHATHPPATKAPQPLLDRWVDERQGLEFKLLEQKEIINNLQRQLAQEKSLEREIGELRQAATELQSEFQYRIAELSEQLARQREAHEAALSTWQAERESLMEEHRRIRQHFDEECARWVSERQALEAELDACRQKIRDQDVLRSTNETQTTALPCSPGDVVRANASASPVETSAASWGWGRNDPRHFKVPASSAEILETPSDQWTADDRAETDDDAFADANSTDSPRGVPQPTWAPSAPWPLGAMPAEDDNPEPEPEHDRWAAARMPRQASAAAAASDSAVEPVWARTATDRSEEADLAEPTEKALAEPPARESAQRAADFLASLALAREENSTPAQEQSRSFTRAPDEPTRDVVEPPGLAPATTKAAAWQPPSNTASPSHTADDESIEAYMARLLERVQARHVPNSPPALLAATEAGPLMECEARLDGPSEESSSDLSDPAPQVNLTPRRSAPERAERLLAMRALANDCTRTAIAEHAHQSRVSRFKEKLALVVCSLICVAASVWFCSANLPLMSAGVLVGLAVLCYGIWQILGYRRGLSPKLGPNVSGGVEGPASVPPDSEV